jgi:hypothetical protein
MLSGNKSDYIDRQPLDDKDTRFLNICVNKIAWAKNHVSINHAPATMEQSKKEVLKSMTEFEAKLIDLLK